MITRASEIYSSSSMPADNNAQKNGENSENNEAQRSGPRLLDSAAKRQQVDRTETCSICLNGINANDTDRANLFCGHSFHRACLAEALKATSMRCPVCKQDVFGSVNHHVSTEYDAEAIVYLPIVSSILNDCGEEVPIIY